MNNRQVRRTVAPNRTDSTTMVLDDSTGILKWIKKWNLEIHLYIWVLGMYFHLISICYIAFKKREYFGLLKKLKINGLNLQLFK